MSIECRYASLLAFFESRDTQLTLPFGDGEDCGQAAGGRFGPGNTCAAGSGGASQPRPRPNPVSGGPRSNTSNGFPPAWGRSSAISHAGDLPGLPGVAKIEARNPKSVRDNARSMGAKSVASLVRLGAGDISGSEVTLNADGTPGAGDDPLEVNIDSSIPVRSADGTRDVGMARVEVSLRRKSKSEDPHVYYDLFHRDTQVAAEITREKNDTGDSPTERKLASLVLDRMLASLEEAEKIGCSYAKTYAAGSVNDSTFKGYRLWGRFGFDAPLSGLKARTLLSDLDSTSAGERILSPEHESKLRQSGSLSLQELLSTKPGERWWAKNGGGINMTLNFRDQNSPGYQRYKKLIEKAKRAKDSGRRTYEAFCEFAANSERDIAEWRGLGPAMTSLELRIASVMAFAQSRNCGTGTGGFQSGNTCASGKIADAAEGAAKGAVKGAIVTAGLTGPVPALIAKGAAVGAAVGAVKGLYDNSMQPTRVMKKIEKIGSTEQQVGDLVKHLGGSPNSVAKVKDGRLTLQVKNERGEKLFDVELGEKQYVITPARKSGTLSSTEMDRVKKIAAENSPKEVAVVVEARSPSYMAKLVRKGFKITANAAGTLVASVVIPVVASVAIGQVEGVIEGVSQALKKKKA